MDRIGFDKSCSLPRIWPPLAPTSRRFSASTTPYDDPGVGKYGVRNAVFPIGDTFLEVVSPKQPGTTAERLLQKRGGDGGYMVILQVDDLRKGPSRVCTTPGRASPTSRMAMASPSRTFIRRTSAAQSCPWIT